MSIAPSQKIPHRFLSGLHPFQLVFEDDDFCRKITPRRAFPILCHPEWRVGRDQIRLRNRLPALRFQAVVLDHFTLLRIRVLAP